jgi:hypothetical protein
MTLQAALTLGVDQGHRLVRFWGDEDIRRASRRGQVRQAGGIPDGRAWYRSPAGETIRQDFETLVSGYRSREIVGKVRDLAPTTHFVTDSIKTQARTADLTGTAPALLTWPTIVA